MSAPAAAAAASSPAAAPASPKAPGSPKPAAAAAASPKREKRATHPPANPSDDEDDAAPAKKKAKASTKKAAAKKDDNKYHLNFNKALDKKYENASFAEIIQLPPSALQGLSNKADKMLAHFHIKTIEDLGKWKFFLMARAIVTLSKVEEKNGRDAKARANINKALDKEFEKKSLVEVCKEHVSALSGLAEWADEVLKPLGAGKVSQLGEWKFALWAEAFTQLAHYETADGASA